MSLHKMSDILSNTKYISEELQSNPIPYDYRSERVDAEDLIRYAMENYSLLEMIVSVAKDCKSLGVKL
jgi:cell fate (sporulation/competence/biofilm development) regulator YmcA (YheA/YmcA/DUF963 family)